MCDRRERMHTNTTSTTSQGAKEAKKKTHNKQQLRNGKINAQCMENRIEITRTEFIFEACSW